MNIHEYQAKAVLREFSVPVPRGHAAFSVAEAVKAAQDLDAPVLVTHQTGPQGKQVHRLYIEEGSAIEREFYLSALVDRESSRIAFVVSTAGGMDIEEVARTSPQQIVTFTVDPATGIMPHHGRRVAQALGLKDDLAKRAERLAAQLYAAFTAKDMSLLEINPLVLTTEK